MGQDRSFGNDLSEKVPQLLGASGVLLLLWSILEPVGLVVASIPDVYRLRYIIGYVTIVPSCVGLIWCCRWLPETDLPAEYYRTIGLFTAVGGGGFLLFNVFLMLFFPAESTWIITNWLRWALSLGLGIGLIVGISYTRGLVESISAERHSLRADHLQKQRDLIDHMNGILRHEVLNSAQIIHGNAGLLKESEEKIDPANDRLDRIYTEGEELADVIQDVRALLQTVEENRELGTIHLSDVLTSELEAFDERYPDVTVNTAIQEGIHIHGNELVRRVFRNLLQNAHEHNSTTSLRIAAEAETTDQTVVVTIRDNGDGIPDYERDTLFERPQVGTHGLGLHIVQRLVNSYGGSIELVETGPDGTTFAVRFPLVESPTRDAGHPSETSSRADAE